MHSPLRGYIQDLERSDIRTGLRGGLLLVHLDSQVDDLLRIGLLGGIKEDGAVLAADRLGAVVIRRGSKVDFGQLVGGEELEHLRGRCQIRT